MSLARAIADDTPRELIRAFDLFDLWQETQPDGSTIEMYRNKTGHRIAQKHSRRRPAIVESLHSHEIAAELISPNHLYCTIGFSNADQKWYAWNLKTRSDERLIIAFSRGDRIFDAGYGNANTPWLQHGARVITSYNDGRQAAVNFAEFARDRSR